MTDVPPNDDWRQPVAQLRDDHDYQAAANAARWARQVHINGAAVATAHGLVATNATVQGLQTTVAGHGTDITDMQSVLSDHRGQINTNTGAIDEARARLTALRGEVCAVDARVDVHETRLNDHDKLLADKPDMPTVIALSAAHGIVWAFVLYFGWLEQFGHTKKVTVDNVETSINYSWQIPATVAVCLGLVIALVTGVVLSLLLRKKVETTTTTTTEAPATAQLQNLPAAPADPTQLALPPAPQLPPPPAPAAPQLGVVYVLPNGVTTQV